MLKDFYEIPTKSCFLVYSSNSIKLSWAAAFKVNFKLIDYFLSRWAGSVFRTLVGGHATFKKELPAPREASKSRLYKCREGLQGKKHLRV